MSDLRFSLEAVPDPRSRRGRWYSLTSILLVCAAAAVSGARTIDELAEWGARRRRAARRARRAPSPAALAACAVQVGDREGPRASRYRRTRCGRGRLVGSPS
ncbi:transposase family protein [Streptomyces sp. NPDC008222]|uniref:transposase family protein n=1 Tax=Streptomyces sp. NPDC008222 TaxID=3364820 RepID=UPI0036EFA308